MLLVALGNAVNLLLFRGLVDRGEMELLRQERSEPLNRAPCQEGGDTVYFTRMLPDNRTGVILSSHLRGGIWSMPALAPFSGSYSDVDPFITPDGSRLFFSSNRPVSGTEPAPSYDIWMADPAAILRRPAECRS